MLENKNIRIIISVVVAICLWGYVIGETNPTAEKTLRDIPVKLINHDVLTESGLAVLSTSVEYVTVTISGNRADVNNVTPNDILAVVDLSEAGMGENQLKIDVRVPERVEIEDKSANKTTVVVEKSKSVLMGIQPKYEGAFAEDAEPITIDMSSKTVRVSGAESQVDKVQFVKAVVAGDTKISHKLKTVTGVLVAEDRHHQPVKNVNLSLSSVNISVQLAKTKTVTLDVPIIDNSRSDVEKVLSRPKTVVIKGKAGDVERIETITTEPVDLTDIISDTTLNLIPILPDGIQLSAKSEGSMLLSVSVPEIKSKSFGFSAGDIEIKGLADGFAVDISDESVEVTVSGAVSAIEQIEAEDFTLSVDLTGMKDGIHSAVLNVVCRKKYGSIDIQPDKINLEITIEE